MYIRDDLLLDSFPLYRIHHCLPCTYGQSIAPLHTPVRDENSPLLYKKLCSTGDGLGYIEKMRLSDPHFFTEKGRYRLGKAYEELLLKSVLSTATEVNALKDPIRLSDILDLCKNKLCQDLRDTVYGTLALADWRNATTLTLDGDILHNNRSRTEA